MEASGGVIQHLCWVPLGCLSASGTPYANRLNAIRGTGFRRVGVTIVVNTGGLGRREGCSCSISRASGEVVASRGCQPTENGGSRTSEAAQAATLQTARNVAACAADVRGVQNRIRGLAPHG